MYNAVYDALAMAFGVQEWDGCCQSTAKGIASAVFQCSRICIK